MKSLNNLTYISNLITSNYPLVLPPAMAPQPNMRLIYDFFLRMVGDQLSNFTVLGRLWIQANWNCMRLIIPSFDFGRTQVINRPIKFPCDFFSPHHKGCVLTQKIHPCSAFTRTRILIADKCIQRHNCFVRVQNPKRLFHRNRTRAKLRSDQKHQTVEPRVTQGFIQALYSLWANNLRYQTNPFPVATMTHYDDGTFAFFM